MDPYRCTPTKDYHPFTWSRSTALSPQYLHVVFIEVLNTQFTSQLRNIVIFISSRLVLWQCFRARREDSRARVTAVTKYRNRILLTLASADNHRSPENHQFMSTLNVKGAQLRKSSVFSHVYALLFTKSVSVYTIVQQWTVYLSNQERQTGYQNNLVFNNFDTHLIKAAVTKSNMSSHNHSGYFTLRSIQISQRFKIL